jgi:lipoprotein-releasing system ATP-binding protein
VRDPSDDPEISRDSATEQAADPAADPVVDPAADPVVEPPAGPPAVAAAVEPRIEAAVPTTAIVRVGHGARVEISHLRKEYTHGGVRLTVLRDVHLSLAAGEMVAVVGSSGVGKSTFLQILGTLDLPTSGSIRFDGEEVTRMGAARLAEFRNKKIGFVFQFHHLLPEFTAEENVMMPALIQRVPRAVARRRAVDILGRVGLGRRLTHKPSELSGGEQQRVALARALVLEPALLLADEPTGNLDHKTSQEIHELFLALNRERGSTLMVVTHNPELAAVMPRCLRMIDGGQLVPADPRAARASAEILAVDSVDSRPEVPEVQP